MPLRTSIFLIEFLPRAPPAVLQSTVFECNDGHYLNIMIMAFSHIGAFIAAVYKFTLGMWKNVSCVVDDSVSRQPGSTDVSEISQENSSNLFSHATVTQISQSTDVSDFRRSGYLVPSPDVEDSDVVGGVPLRRV